MYYPRLTETKKALIQDPGHFLSGRERKKLSVNVFIGEFSRRRKQMFFFPHLLIFLCILMFFSTSFGYLPLIIFPSLRDDKGEKKTETIIGDAFDRKNQKNRYRFKEKCFELSFMRIKSVLFNTS